MKNGINIMYVIEKKRKEICTKGAFFYSILSESNIDEKMRCSN